MTIATRHKEAQRFAIEPRITVIEGGHTILMGLHRRMNERPGYSPSPGQLEYAFKACEKGDNHGPYYIMALMLAERFAPDRIESIHVAEVERRSRIGNPISAVRIARIDLRDERLVDGLFDKYLDAEKNVKGQFVRKKEAVSLARELGKHEKAEAILAPLG